MFHQSTQYYTQSGGEISVIHKAFCYASAWEIIIESSPSIVYTDFIADIGPIVGCLADLGIEAVGYHGEMDPPSRHGSYMN